MSDAVKSLKKLDATTYGAVVTIDVRNGIMEIDGHGKLKKILFEISPYIIMRWRETDPGPNIVELKPEGAKFFLPFLPLGGINAMTLATLLIYWSPIMQVVVGHRALGYQSIR